MRLLAAVALNGHNHILAHARPHPCTHARAHALRTAQGQETALAELRKGIDSIGTVSLNVGAEPDEKPSPAAGAGAATIVFSVKAPRKAGEQQAPEQAMPPPTIGG